METNNSLTGRQCFFLHAWGLWRPYNREYEIMYLGQRELQCDARQHRACMYCGKVQDLLIQKNLRIPYGAKSI